jgi:hypothetical protein
MRSQVLREDQMIPVTKRVLLERRNLNIKIHHQIVKILYNLSLLKSRRKM